MSENKYTQEIQKTGFILEYRIANILRQAGWTVISNKYYEDDFEGSVREIDLLAYKVSKVQQVDVYTTLLVSCKKSAADIWALLARKINLKDPNSNWWPLHVWSNDKAMGYEIAKPATAKNYHNEMIRLGVKEALSTPDYEVFAFQEMNRISGAPHNDKNIFSAVTSLMKAQAYELGALSQRKKTPSCYQFNLLSVIESDLVRLVIDNDVISEETIEAEHYIFRYIIKKNETSSRIRFITYASFLEKLKDYDRLHQANCNWCDAADKSFYSKILEDYKRRNILIDDFRAKTRWAIYWLAKQRHGVLIAKEDISVSWSNELSCAVVYIDCDEAVIPTLNEDLSLHAKVTTGFKEVYRYDGEFRFEVDDIPF